MIKASWKKYSISVLFVLLATVSFLAADFSSAAADEKYYPGYRPPRHVHYSLPPADYSDYYINADNIARISVLIGGSRAKIYSHYGEYFIEGREGLNYTLLITNLCGSRIKVSAAVDGLDVIDGRKASFTKPGYIINAYANANIKGWRISDDEVASFKFGPISESYAMKMDRPSEIGKMSFGFFRERQPVVYIDDLDYPLYKNKSEGGQGRSAASDEYKKAAPAASKLESESAQSIGTEFGDRRQSRISHTDFDAETRNPQTIIKINYASYDDLVRRGVIHGKDIIIQDEPQTRNKYEKDGVYSRPPEDWRK
ncbi:MAG TPA: hypothetical protein PK467_16710 [Candidatus Wallbacteria bacterium]|nr:hypothetical protein [Candidatus Wallbacteria bacterium]